MTKRKIPKTSMTPMTWRDRAWSRDHGLTCWTYHEDCALRAATALMDTRIDHSIARRETFRMARRWRADAATHAEAVELARRTLAESHGYSWKDAEAHS